MSVHIRVCVLFVRMPPAAQTPRRAGMASGSGVAKVQEEASSAADEHGTTASDATVGAAKVSFAEQVLDVGGLAKSALALPGTPGPAHPGAQADSVVSGKRTRKKKIMDDFVVTPVSSRACSSADAAAPDSPVVADRLSAAVPPLALAQAGSFGDQAGGVTAPAHRLGPLEQASCNGAAATELSAEVSSYLTSAVEQGSLDFQSAADKLFDSLMRLQVDSSAICTISADVAAEVMGQANDFVAILLTKSERALSDDEIAVEALQSILLSLRLLFCRTEHRNGSVRDRGLDDQREDLMEKVLKLFDAFLRRWSMAALDDQQGGGEGSSRRAKSTSLVACEALAPAASASLQALTAGAKDASNEKHCVAIIRLSIQAIVCDQLPVVQAEGIKLLKSIFSSNTKHREIILEEVPLLFEPMHPCSLL